VLSSIIIYLRTVTRTMESATLEAPTSSLQLKADFMPLTVIRLNDGKLDQIKKELEQSITNAPNYFKDAPVIIDLGGINEQLKSFLDLPALCKILRSLSMIPIGIRGLSQKLLHLAEENHLAVLNQRTKPEKEEAQKETPKATEPVEKKAPAKQEVAQKTYTKIITKPVRSGTQVYAKGGDLLVLAAVNAGAEVIADGNIHIHGPLRGRALAGAKGDTSAHIFCQKLEAELVAVAGQYLLSEQFEKITSPKSMIHIHLKADKLNIDLT
jgi:septum site-determining protein MinC